MRRRVAAFLSADVSARFSLKSALAVGQIRVPSTSAGCEAMMLSQSAEGPEGEGHEEYEFEPIGDEEGVF